MNNLSVALFTSVMVTGALAGCTIKYGCPAPEGVQCKPISEVYRSVSQTGGTVPKGKGSAAPTKTPSAAPGVEGSAGGEADGPSPIRSAPKILRVWVAPWIDTEGDLHQQSYLYVVIDHGAWAMGLPAVESEPVPTLGNSPEGIPQAGGEGHAK